MGYVVVGLDHSKASHQAFRTAIQEAEWRGASVLAIYAVPIPVITEYNYARYLDDSLRVGQEILEEDLNKLEREYDGGFPVDVKHKIVTGHVGARVVEAASGADGDKPAELLVLGSRGLGGVKGLLLGSVSTYASHHLTCPLLIVPMLDDDDTA